MARAKKTVIEKQPWKPGNVLAPVPVVLVSCGSGDLKPNIITIAWTGNVCTSPPMLTISIRPERYSYQLIRDCGEFVVNVPSRQQAKVTDWCGMVSGQNMDKFAESGLGRAPGLEVKCPIILECPINIECKVKEEMPLGSHNMFIAEIVAVQVSSDLLDEKNKFRLDRANLLTYGLGHYYALGEQIDHFGFSIRKRNKPKPKTASTRNRRRRPPAKKGEGGGKPKK